MTLMPCVSVYSQLGDLAFIEAVTKAPKAEIQDEIDVEEVPKKAKVEANFEDSNYGYTGGKNFVNPPQEIFFDETLSYFAKLADED